MGTATSSSIEPLTLPPAPRGGAGSELADGLAALAVGEGEADQVLKAEPEPGGGAVPTQWRVEELQAEKGIAGVRNVIDRVAPPDRCWLGGPIGGMRRCVLKGANT